MAPRSQFKVVERRIAAMIGGQRVPVTGRGRGSAPDVAHAWLSVEIKSYDRRPPSIHEAMAQAEASAGKGQLPVAIFHRNGDDYSEAVIMCRLGDWLDHFGDDKPTEATA